jgi:hypothetical protein
MHTAAKRPGTVRKNSMLGGVLPGQAGHDGLASPRHEVECPSNLLDEGLRYLQHREVAATRCLVPVAQVLVAGLDPLPRQPFDVPGGTPSPLTARRPHRTAPAGSSPNRTVPTTRRSRTASTASRTLTSRVARPLDGRYDRGVGGESRCRDPPRPGPCRPDVLEPCPPTRGARERRCRSTPSGSWLIEVRAHRASPSPASASPT